jgi:MFS family permease
VVLLGLMVVAELRSPAPIINVRLFKDSLFRSCNSVMTLESVAFLGSLYTMSLYFQDGRGLSPLAAGLSIWPEAFGVMTGSQLGSRVLYRRLGPRLHLTVGVAGSSLFIALLSSLGDHSSTWYAWLLMYLTGLAVGQVFVATQAAAFATITPAASGRAATLFNAGRRLGGAIGVAVATTTIVVVDAGARTAGGTGADVTACRVAFLVAAAINLLGIRAAWSVRDSDAANTIPARRRRKRLEGAAAEG